MVRASLFMPLAAAASIVTSPDTDLFLNMIQYSSDDCSGAEVSTLRYYCGSCAPGGPTFSFRYSCDAAAGTYAMTEFIGSPDCTGTAIPVPAAKADGSCHSNPGSAGLKTLTPSFMDMQPGSKPVLRGSSSQRFSFAKSATDGFSPPIMFMTNSLDCDRAKTYASQSIQRCTPIPNVPGEASSMVCTADGKGFESCMYSDTTCTKAKEMQCYPVPPGSLAPGKCDNTSIANQSFVFSC